MNLEKREQGEIIPKRFRFTRGAIWLFFATSVLLLVYTWYRAEIVLHGSRGGKYLKYYLISLAAILFWGVVLRLKDEIKLNITMVTTSLVVGIYLIEIIIPLKDANPASQRLAAAKALGVEFDARTKYQIYRDMKSDGVEVVPSIPPANHLFKEVPGVELLHPLGGVSKKTTVHCNESGKYFIFLSDRYGFNNPDSEWDSLETKWVLIGDSFVMGSCVNPGEEIAGQIRSITAGSVINLGVAGNGPLAELAVFKEYAKSRKSKTVLWFYTESNDMADLVKERSSPLLMSYLQPEFSQNLIHRQKEIDNRLNKYIADVEVKAEAPPSHRGSTVVEALLRQSRFFLLPNIRQHTGFDIFIDPLFTEILKRARDRTEAWGGNSSLSICLDLDAMKPE